MMSLKVAVALTLVLTGVVCQRPEIVDEILPEVKKVGTIGRLNCTVINMDNQAFVTWNLVKHQLVISENENIVVLINPEIDGRKKYNVVITGNELTKRTTYTLEISQLNEEDSAYYTCYVRIPSLSHLEWPKKQGLLTVQVPPTIRPEATGEVEIHEGGTVNLTCGATGIPYPNITWTRADGGLLPHGGALLRNDVLTLSNITKEERGLYRCVADNTVSPPAEHQARVHVFFAPMARAVQDTVGQAQNKRYSSILVCVVTGFPEPETRWIHETNEGIVSIKDDEKYDISKQNSDNLDETWYSLKVKNVQANDYGNYKCIVTNELGAAEVTINLFDTTSGCNNTACRNQNHTEETTHAQIRDNTNLSSDCNSSGCSNNNHGGETGHSSQGDILTNTIVTTALVDGVSGFRTSLAVLVSAACLFKATMMQFQ